MRGSDVDRVLALLAGPTNGVFLASEAWKLGVTRAALHHRKATGRLVHLHERVWLLADHPLTWRAQLQAALFDAGPGAVVALRSAARLHGCYRHRATSLVEVTRLRGSNHRVSLGRLRETRWLPPEHVTMIHGFPVTTLARTAFDLAGDPRPPWRSSHPAHQREIARVLNDALGRRGLTFVAEAAVLAALARRGRNGTRLIRSLLEEFGPQYVPTMSDTEFLFTEVVHAFGLSDPERQVALAGPEGWIGTVDFYFRRWRLVVEIDSTWHDGPLDQREDARRDEQLRAAGYSVLRFRYRDLVLRPEWVVARILAVAG